MKEKQNQIQKKILKILLKYNRPVCTRELALQLKASWHKIHSQCLELKIQGKVERMRIGTTHAWSIKQEKTVDALLQKTLDEEIELLKKQLEEVMKKKEEVIPKVYV